MESEAQGISGRPWPGRELAWRYLTEQLRMVRMVETLEPFTVRHGRSTIEVDVALPPEATDGSRWLVPVVFLDKRPVAPDLEVRDATGAVVAVPTKHENQELTMIAMERMQAGGLLDLDAHPDLRKIVGDIVCMRPLVAEVATLQLLERLPKPPEALSQLLGPLTHQFLLWVPVEGTAGSTHHFSIRRRQPRFDPPVIPHKGEEVAVKIDTAIGEVEVVGLSGREGRRTLDVRVGLERMLRILGLAPISFTESLQEAWRSDSYHACLKSPRDFVVREVRLGRILIDGADSAERHLEELEDEPNQTIQGHDSEIAHVHCVRRKDQAPLMLEVLLGVRDGLTTLWALGVMLTTVLLRIFKHEIEPAIAPGHLEVAAAILLLGPALAAAWAVRSDEGHLLRNVLSGTRQLLMGSALLSVAAALALIGYTPFHLSQTHAIEWYAGASYAIAVVVAISWSITRKTPWIFYRFLLYTPRRNLWATALLAALAAALVAHTAVPEWVVGVGLLGLGFSLAAISANRVGVAMGGVRRPFAPLAGLAATVAFLAAGSSLGYYDDAVDRSLLRLVVCAAEAALAVWALLRVRALGPEGR